MEPNGAESVLARDVLRGAGYAVTAFSLVLLSFGHPAPWLPWLAAAGIAALVSGVLIEAAHRGHVDFMLNRRQSAAFVVGAVVFWATVGLTGANTWGATAGCSSDYQTFPLGDGNVTVDLASPPGDADVVPLVGGLVFPPNDAQGAHDFAAPNGTAFIRLLLVAGLDIAVEQRGDDGSWAGAPGGGADVQDGWQPYGRAHFADEQLRVSVRAAPPERDGTTQVVRLQFLGERDVNECMASYCADEPDSIACRDD
ncbi:MAG: hypothetical protein AABY18_07925 [Candidatus Thermoplasmatota archaeon]